MNEVLKLYDLEVRSQPLETDAVTVIKDESITYLIFPGGLNFVSSWSFSDATAERNIRQHVDRCRKANAQLMWRIYEHDEPRDIERHLAQFNFAHTSSGTLMYAPLESVESHQTCFDIRRVSNAQALRDYLSVTGVVFGDSNDGQYQNYINILSHEKVFLLCVYDNNKPVASARIELSSRNTFALMYAGAVLPDYRSKGIYKALVTARVNIARLRGAKFVCTEAWKTSYPVLRKIGLQSLSSENTWIFNGQQKIHGHP